MPKPAQQLYLADDMQPPPDPLRDPALDEIVYAWVDARESQRAAADTTKIRHGKLIEQLAERGLDRYPYLDRVTGKKLYAVVDKTPRVKSSKPPQVRKPKRDRYDKAHQPTPAEVAAETVEHRRVNRADALAEISRGGTAGISRAAEIADGFASVRASMAAKEST